MIEATAAVEWGWRVSRVLERSAGVILMYHAIDSPQGYAGRPPVTLTHFTDQLELVARRYGVTSLADLSSGRSPAPKRVALTFDDGHRSFSVKALPLLLERRIPATIFVCASLLGTDDFISREELRGLAQMPGIEIGNHTRTHPDLRAEPSAIKLESEIRGGRQELEDLIGSSVTSFAYPYGRLSPASVDLVRRTHARAVTVLPGVVWPDSDPVLLPRVAATGNGLSRFAFDLTDMGQVRSWYRRYDPQGHVRWHLPWRRATT